MIYENNDNNTSENSDEEIKTKIKELHEKISSSYDLTELINMQVEISELHNDIISKKNYYSNYNVSIYSGILKDLSDRINLINPNFKKELIILSTENVNGCDLYNSKHNIMCFSEFLKFKNLFLDTTVLDFEEFYQEFDKIACTEWAKMNTTGDEFFVGFWQTDKDNAWNLTRRNNASALFNLPYSKKLLLETVIFGCCNRMESVRYSNFLCVWIERKIELMKTTVIIVDKTELQRQWLQRFNVLYPCSMKVI